MYYGRSQKLSQKYETGEETVKYIRIEELNEEKNLSADGRKEERDIQIGMKEKEKKNKRKENQSARGEETELEKERERKN